MMFPLGRGSVFLNRPGRLEMPGGAMQQRLAESSKQEAVPQRRGAPALSLAGPLAGDMQAIQGKAEGFAAGLPTTRLATLAQQARPPLQKAPVKAPAGAAASGDAHPANRTGLP
ncbi:MAG: hypothetical protein RIR00_1237, partial [Pseudomonadota bacterium]